MKKVMIQPSVIMRERDYEAAFELWSLTSFDSSKVKETTLESIRFRRFL